MRVLLQDKPEEPGCRCASVARFFAGGELNVLRICKS
jgi:hypothetical protein